MRAREWLQIQSNLGLAPKTIVAYGQALHDFIRYSQVCRFPFDPDQATKSEIASYIKDLTSRPNPKGVKVLQIETGIGLSNATIHVRLSVLRQYFDYLVECEDRKGNPIPRGQWGPNRGFGVYRPRGIIREYVRLPWLPGEDEWARLINEMVRECTRNQCMLLMQYEGALRVSELVSLHVEDVDVRDHLVRIRPERCKTRTSRVVRFGRLTADLLRKYMDWRADHGFPSVGPLWIAESNRNYGKPGITEIAWSKALGRMTKRANLEHKFTTHTPRHMRLTELARLGHDLDQIAKYAGHTTLETTRLYIHLAGKDLSAAVAASLNALDERLAQLYREAMAVDRSMVGKDVRA